MFDYFLLIGVISGHSVAGFVDFKVSREAIEAVRIILEASLNYRNRWFDGALNFGLDLELSMSELLLLTLDIRSKLDGILEVNLSIILLNAGLEV